MKQRVKLAQAIFADAPVLMLDEPCTNLDKAGIDLYNKMIQDFCKEKIIIIASNDPNEYSFCTNKINIMDFKRNK
jgi:ABC-type multidrug transport system ATPase subunit